MIRIEVIGAPRSRAISDRSGGCLPNQSSESVGIAELMVSKGLSEVNIKFVASSDSGIFRSAAMRL